MSEFLTIVIFHLFAVASPGPDFVLITRQCFRYGRVSSIWTSLGISMGILIHVCISLLGLGLIIKLQENIFTSLKILASIYIGYLGINSLFTQNYSPQKNEKIFNYKYIATGFITNVLNPKAFLFFITVFTLIIDSTTPKNLQIIYGIYMSLATFIWFTFISYVFTNKLLKDRYQAYIPFIERITGILLVIIAFQILFF